MAGGEEDEQELGEGLGLKRLPHQAEKEQQQEHQRKKRMRMRMRRNIDGLVTRQIHRRRISHWCYCANRHHDVAVVAAVVGEVPPLKRKQWQCREAARSTTSTAEARTAAC